MKTARMAQTRIRKARAELASAHAGIERDIAPWRRALNRRRMAWIVAGGFVGGFALSWLPPRLWARIGAVVGSSAAVMARSLVTPMIAGALLARKEDRAAAAAESEESAAR
ncbi:MAG TPA: hypothetical protein VLB69_14595 [Rudaea sp.]|nr:hypothetical protein [Rudaea sp.]